MLQENKTIGYCPLWALVQNPQENWIQQHIKRIVYHRQVGFNLGIQEEFNIKTLVKVIDHIAEWSIGTQSSQLMQKKHLTNSMPFHDKNTQHNSSRRNNVSRIKDIYKKPTANLILNGDRIKAFTLRSGERWDIHYCHFYST